MEAILGDDAGKTPLAGFWRRLAAFVIDGILLGLAGNMVGQILFDPLAFIGGWGRLIGFTIAVAYFGLFDSGRFGAATPGKRVAGLRVVDAAGHAVSLPRSLIRAVLLTAPFVFSGMILVISEASLVELIFSGLAAGLVAASLYMAAFNRGTRQGLHDLAVGTYVVLGSASRTSLEGLAMWRPHALIAASLLVVSVSASMLGYPVWVKFSPGVSVEATLPPHGGAPVLRAAWMMYSPAQGGPRTCDHLTVMLRGTGVDDEALARRIASAMALHFHCHIETHLSVRMLYLFDLGFAAGRKYRDFMLDEASFSHSP